MSINFLKGVSWSVCLLGRNRRNKNKLISLFSNIILIQNNVKVDNIQIVNMR